MGRARLASGCEARSSPIATRRSRLVGWLGGLGVSLVAVRVLALTRSACGEDQPLAAQRDERQMRESRLLELRAHRAQDAPARRLRIASIEIDEEARTLDINIES
jgi:hypothetical protein